MTSPTSSFPGLPASAGHAQDAVSETGEWFATEVHCHESSLHAYLRLRFPALGDPEDLVQETYLRVLKARKTGKQGMNKTYLFTIARNVALDLCRRRRVVPIECLADLCDLSVLEGAPDAAQTLTQEQEISLLSDAIRALPDRCRQVVTLRKIYGLTHGEIASRLGIARNTVNAQLTLGMARLRDWLRAHGVNHGPRP